LPRASCDREAVRPGTGCTMPTCSWKAKKMSKRLGNYYTLRDLLGKGWSGREIRYVLLSAHYRDPLNLPWTACKRRGRHLQTDGRVSPKARRESCRSVPDLQSRFDAAMDDDLNTSAALGALFEFIREPTSGRLRQVKPRRFLRRGKRVDQVLGFGLPVKSEVPPTCWRWSKNGRRPARPRISKRSDEIRDQLAKQGWVVEDTPKGSARETRLKRVSWS